MGRDSPVVVLLLAGSMALFGGAGCSQPKSPIRNVLLISIDTLRADRLGCYGFDAAQTPAIDGLAATGIRFDRAYSPVPITLPAHASMLTGRIPPAHGVRDNAGYRLAGSETTLAEILKRNGFQTAAVTAAFVLDSRFGLAQGFSSYDDRFEQVVDTNIIAERRGDEVRRQAESWLERNGSKPFFLFVHFYDPHQLYEAPEPFRSRFGEDPYSGEIAYVDEQVRSLLARLVQLGIDDSTLVVLTSDHGELLGEHGEDTHTFFVYENAIRVPLIFRLPETRAARVVETPVGLIDIVPTICTLLGIAIPDEVQGHDLSSALLGTESPDAFRELYAESLLPAKYAANPLFALVGQRWKYILTTRPELYDLVQDPTEAQNLIGGISNSATAESQAMNRRLIDLLERELQDGGTDRLALDDQARRRLESLGYIGGISSVPDAGIDPQREDPKDLIGFHREYLSVPFLFAQGKLDEADVKVASLLERRAGFAEGHLFRARIAERRGDVETSLVHYRRALESDPSRADVHNDLGSALAGLGRSEDAIVHLRQSLELQPASAAAHTNLGNALIALGDRSGAIEHYQAALRLDADSTATLLNLGLALSSEGRTREAIESLRRAIEIEPSARAHLALGAARNRENPDAAIEHYRAALAIDPRSAPAHYNLGVTLRAQGAVSEAIEHLRQAIEIRPEYARAHFQLARSLVALDRLAEAMPRYRAAMQQRPDWPDPAIELAWILAVHPDPAIREPAQAVELAETAVRLTGSSNPTALDALAAGHASAGDFDRATSIAESALELESNPGRQSRLELYRTHQPYTAPTTAPPLLPGN